MPLEIERIRKSTRRVAKFAKRSSKRPSPDEVHKLRTSARHLESALSSLQLADERGVGSLLRHLKKIRRLAGALRDMDVLTANALDIDHRGERDCLVRLLEHLGAERSRRAGKLRRMIARKRSKIRRALRRGLERIERARKKPRSAGAALGVGVLQVSSKLSHPGRLTRNNLHEYRSQVKELRDALRLSDRTAHSTLVRKLEDVKGAIGDWHDWVELTDIAVDVLDHRPSCALVKRLETSRDSKYRHALSLTHTLIARHLRPKRRKRPKRTAGKAPIATPVLEAVAAIAHDGDPERAH